MILDVTVLSTFLGTYITDPGVIDICKLEDEYADLTKRAGRIYHIILNLGYDVRVRYYESVLLNK